jgi:hypothetical protein
MASGPLLAAAQSTPNLPAAGSLLRSARID